MTFRPSRLPTVAKMVDAKFTRIAAQRAANAVDVNANFTLSEKLVNVVAASRHVSVKDFQAAQRFRTTTEQRRKTAHTK